MATIVSSLCPGCNPDLTPPANHALNICGSCRFEMEYEAYDDDLFNACFGVPQAVEPFDFGWDHAHDTEAGCDPFGDPF